MTLLRAGLVMAASMAVLASVPAKAQDDEGMRHMRHRMMRHEMHRDMMRHEMRRDMMRHDMHREMRHERHRRMMRNMTND
ncbi:hypothetical protein [Lichenifustis flavocetrariae]|uniref:Uncharacterized protein n=1 Tax=Lichenifustis flavocetrariae TaxID=2949735 RepID=A0AA41YU40_9HYPH|nr:hypothetical protein [Lichenifustis flavocetrariae]MCW6508184.1 hypothetical protein [Lichenifustis flavocetrariae]